MRAWLMQSYEGVDKLELKDAADPKPGAGEALLRTRFAALNPADAFLARAMYPANPPLPHILGRDGVGTSLASCAATSAFPRGALWQRKPSLPRRAWLRCRPAGHWKRWRARRWHF